MKKIIILTMILLPFTIMAQFYKGVITLNNDETIKAYINVPFGSDSKLKYRFTADGNNEKLSVDEVKSIEFTNNNNMQVVYHTMYISFPKFLKPSSFNISDKKHWARLLKEGKINLYEVCIEERSATAISYTYRYYITDENDKYARFLFSPMSDVLKRIKYKYNKLDYYIKLYYENKCPDFVKSIKYEDLENYGLGKIVDLYESNCDN
jgi:hypothetical protein